MTRDSLWPGDAFPPVIWERPGTFRLLLVVGIGSPRRQGFLNEVTLLPNGGTRVGTWTLSRDNEHTAAKAKTA